VRTMMRTLSAAGLFLFSSTATPWACGGGGVAVTQASYALSAASHLTAFLNDLLSAGGVVAGSLSPVAGLIDGMLFDVAEVTLQPGMAQNLKSGISYFGQLSQTKDMAQVEALHAGFTTESFNQMMSQMP
jgi:hypothetical protein